MICPKMAITKITAERTPNSILHPNSVPIVVIIGKPIPSPSVDPDMVTAMALPGNLEGTSLIAYAETIGHNTPALIPPTNLAKLLKNKMRKGNH